MRHAILAALLCLTFALLRVAEDPPGRRPHLPAPPRPTPCLCPAPPTGPARCACDAEASPGRHASDIHRGLGRRLWGAETSAPPAGPCAPDGAVSWWATAP